MNALRAAARSPQRLFLHSGLAIALAVYQNPRWGNISRMGLLLILLTIGLAAQAIESGKSVSSDSRLGHARSWNLWVGWGVLATAFLVLSAALVRNLPGDVIDVNLFEVDSARALLHGVNPYTITHANIYGPRDHFYAPGILRGGRVHVGYPYPPLAVYYLVPAYLLGDVRYAPLAAILVSAFLIFAARPHWQTLGIVCLLLVNPLTVWVITQSWTEPLVLCTLCWVVYLASRKSRWLPLAVGLFLASKQYTVLALPFVPFLLPQGRWKDHLRLASQAILIVLAVSAPLALWNLRSFWADIVVFLMHVPYRPDSLIFGAPAPLPVAWSLVGAGLAIVFSLAKSPRHPAMFAGCFGFTFLIFVCLSKGAFANYYFLISSLFWTAAAALPIPFGAEMDSRRSAAVGSS